MRSVPHDADSLAELLAAEFSVRAPGASLPSELELAQQFDVSRSVVRKALASLESRLLITRIRGRGTFVPQRLELTLSNRVAPSMHTLVKSAGRNLRSTLLSSGTGPLPARVAELLQVDPATPTLMLTRLGTIDEHPFTFAVEWVLPNRTHDLDVALGVYKSVYEALVAFGYSPLRASTSASVTDLPEAARRHLQLERPALGWNLTTLTVDEHSGAPVMASTTWLRLESANITVAVDKPEG